MNNPAHFENIEEYYNFIYAISYMMIIELAIWIHSLRGWFHNRNTQSKDLGTVLLVILGCWGSFYFSAFFREPFFVKSVGEILLPHVFYYAGLFLIVAGATLRTYAVWSLKNSFTLSVKTSTEQQLLTTEVYRFIRNPAYAGTIASMVGNAFCFRSAFAPIIVIAICLLCYGIRIKIEEKALHDRFGNDFIKYCSQSWRLIPFLW